MARFNYFFATYDIKYNTFRLLEIPFISFSEHCLLNEELDSMSMTIINDSQEEMAVFTIINFSIRQDNNTTLNKYYFIARDNVNVISKMKPFKYEHNLELIELTKKLEKFITETLCFTQSQDGKPFYTIEDALYRISLVEPLGEDIEINQINRQNFYNSLDNNTTSYKSITKPSNRIIQTISTSLSNITSKIEAPQLVLDESTLREKVDQVLKYINAVARIDVSGGSKRNANVLNADLFNNLRNLIIFLKENEDIRQNGFESVIRDINVEDYNTNIETFGDNLLDSQEAVIYPSDKTFDYLRTQNNYSLNDTNFGILTDYPIYKVNDVLIPIKVRGFATNAVAQNYEHPIVVPLKDYIVEEQIFNSLSTEVINTTFNKPENLTKLSKYNTVYYTYKNNFVNLASSVELTLSTSFSFLNALGWSLIRLVKQHLETDVIWDKNSHTFTVTGDFFPDQLKSFLGNQLTYEYSINSLTNSNWIGIDIATTNQSLLLSIGISAHFNANLNNSFPIENWSFSVTTNNTDFKFEEILYRIDYTPIYNSRFAVCKQDISQNFYETTSLENQSNRIISFENLANKLQSTSQRKGNVERQVTIRHQNLDDIYHISDYTNDNEIITECEYIYYNDYIIGKYILSKNYNRLSEYIGVDSEIRQWQLPSGSQTFERKLLIKNFVGVDTKKIEDNSYVTNSGKYNFLYAFLDDGTSTPSDTGPLYIQQYINSALYNTEDVNVKSDWYKKTGIGNDYSRLLMECAAKGGGNTISMNVKFEDNISYKFIRNKKQVLTEGKILLEKVPYCIPNGRYMGFLRNFDLLFASQNLNLFDSDERQQFIPIIDLDNSSAVKTVETQRILNELILVQIPPMLVLKDPSEILSIDYQLNIYSNNPQIIIGKYFSIDNHLIDKYNRDSDRLYVFGSTKQIATFSNDQIDITSNSITSYGTFNSNFTFNSNCYTDSSYYFTPKNDFITSIAGNESLKHIIIASKKNDNIAKIHLILNVDLIKENETIYFNFTKERNGIVNIY